MFFLSWGSSGKSVHVGSAGLRHCSSCGQDSEFQAFVTYTLRHIYWLFRWVTNREPQIVCGHCGATYWGDEVVDDSTAKKAIPFFDRRGWTLGAGAIASLFGVGAIASAANSQQNGSFIQSPHSGDLYEVDLAKMSDKPEAPVMYSVMRVTDVGRDDVKVQVSAGYYTDIRGIEGDVTDGKAARADYYAPEEAVLPRSALAKMYADGVISDVVR